jgi:uncharacterized membrane protein YfcA
MIILFTLFILGCFLGFVGAGGAGMVIAVLATIFGIPIHVALGTSLSAMGFTTLSGAFSHYREGNVVLKSGLAVGFFGAFGSFAGAKISAAIPGAQMHWLTGALLYITAILVYFKVFHPDSSIFAHISTGKVTSGRRFWITAIIGGIVNGLLSGTFGIGATPFIQLTLMLFFGLTMIEAVGTTMLVILPIAVMGGFGYMTSGLLDLHLFVEVVVGLMSGAYLGAKFTKRANPKVLKVTMVVVPTLGATMLIFG